MIKKYQAFDMGGKELFVGDTVGIDLSNFYDEETIREVTISEIVGENEVLGSEDSCGFLPWTTNVRGHLISRGGSQLDDDSELDLRALFGMLAANPSSQEEPSDTKCFSYDDMVSLCVNSVIEQASYGDMSLGDIAAFCASCCCIVKDMFELDDTYNEKIRQDITKTVITKLYK